MARMGLSVRNLRRVIASLQQYGEEAQARAKAVAEESAERAYQTAQSLCPEDTGFMKSAMRKQITAGGFGYEVGWYASDFRAAGKDFYPLPVEFGSRFVSAQPCIVPTGDVERPRFRRDLAEALSPRRGRAA